MPQMSDILQEINKILDISSRVDERVKIIQGVQVEINKRLETIAETVFKDSSRIAVLESKNGHRTHELEEGVHNIELKLAKIESSIVTDESFQDLENKVNTLEVNSSSWTSHVKFYGNLAVQAVWIIVVSYLLFRLGLNTPVQ